MTSGSSETCKTTVSWKNPSSIFVQKMGTQKFLAEISAEYNS